MSYPKVKASFLQPRAKRKKKVPAKKINLAKMLFDKIFGDKRAAKNSY